MDASATHWARALTGFAHADVSLATARAMQRRAESKFVVPECLALEVIASLRPDCDVLAAGHALVARYRSLYFDTEDLSFFHAHRRGYRVRYKVRIRHYPDRALSVTEIKVRGREHDATKLRREREYGDNALHQDDLQFVRAYCGASLDLVPQAWVTYRRITLLGRHCVERITVDSEIDVRRAAGGRRLSNAAVIEVKQPRLDRWSPVMRRLRAAGCRPGWMSKYCTAIAMTSPDVRASRLTSRLRALQTVGTWVGTC